MNQKERITLRERLASVSAKHMPRITGVTVALLFLLTVTAVAVMDAFEIRHQLEIDLQKQFGVITSRVEAVGALPDAPKENLYSAYQQAMSNGDDLSASAYDFISGSFLMNSAGDVILQSRNVMILEMSKDGESWTKIPLAFPGENTSEVAAMLWSDMSAYPTTLTVNPKSNSADYRWAVITGYWEDNLFWMHEIRKEGFALYSGVDIPEGKEAQRYVVNALDPDAWHYLKTIEISKNFGSDNFRTENFVSGWKQTDRLMEKTAGQKLFREMGWWYGGLDNRGSLISMDSVGFAMVDDPHHVFTASGRMQLVYCTKYSPMGLALGGMLRDRTLLCMLVLYAVLGAFLVIAQSRLRKKELQGLNDEIQRQKKALDYARDAEASRRQMTSAIAHELKTPIAVLSSYSEALQENIEAEKQSHYLGVIREETEKMDRMVLELLDLSRLEAGKYKLRREKFDLEELAREIIRPLEGQITEKSITLNWQIGEKEVVADRYRFGQVIENYVTNAIRHTPEGGKIIIRLGMNKETVSVENSGRSIPSDQLPKVWETFWQGDQSRNKRGSGLGLSICRSIMLLHGGSCRVENTASGVRFTASIDAERPAVYISTMPKEKTVELEYPIAREYTTVDRVFLRLRLLNAVELRREIRAGNVRCGKITLGDFQDKLYPGNVVEWEDFRITITVDNALKHRAILINQLGASGRLSNFAPHVGATTGTGGA